MQPGANTIGAELVVLGFETLEYFYHELHVAILALELAIQNGTVSGKLAVNANRSTVDLAVYRAHPIGLVTQAGGESLDSE